MMKRIVTLTLLLGLLISLPLSVVAQSSGQVDVPGGVDIGLEGTGLGTIELPTFFNSDQIDNFSLFSYVSLALNLAFIGIVILWGVMAFNAGRKVLGSEGQSTPLEEANEKFKNVFASITILFGFFLILILLTSFLGIGNFFQWPVYLSVCNDGEYYFQKVIRNADGTGNPDNACFGQASTQTSNTQRVNADEPAEGTCSQEYNICLDECTIFRAQTQAAERNECEERCRISLTQCLSQV